MIAEHVQLPSTRVRSGAVNPAGKLTSTVSSPIQVHGVEKVAAKRAPEIGEHNDQVLQQLGFSTAEIEGLRASGAIAKARKHAA